MNYDSASTCARQREAEGTGFEPVKDLRPRVFETRALDHYANPPGLINDDRDPVVYLTPLLYALKITYDLQISPLHVFVKNIADMVAYLVGPH